MLACLAIAQVAISGKELDAVRGEYALLRGPGKPCLSLPPVSDTEDVALSLVAQQATQAGTRVIFLS